jgi:hypothetical protein
MSVTSDFYRTRAAECLAEANQAQLENVRLRYLRAEAVWRSMADRLTQSEDSRAKEEREKAARR